MIATVINWRRAQVVVVVVVCAAQKDARCIFDLVGTFPMDFHAHFVGARDLSRLKYDLIPRWSLLARGMQPRLGGMSTCSVRLRENIAGVRGGDKLPLSFSF